MAPVQPFRVAIIGGGIGGLYAALSLNHHTQNSPVIIDVYEQASEFKEIGAGVGLAVNAAKLVHRIGLGDGLNKIAGFRNGIWIDFRRSDNGERIVAVESDDTAKIRQAPISRSDLLDLFRHAIEERRAANLHTKKRFSKAEDLGDQVIVHFEDSTSVSADLVIACDGIHSAVRAQHIDDQPIYSGQIAYRAVLPADLVDDWWPYPSYSNMWCGKHKHFLTFPISANKQVNVVAFANAKAKDAEKIAESWVSTCDRKDVEDDYADFEPIVKRLIALMPQQPSKWRINDREPLDQWQYMGGKIILLGDAAHAMLPHMGAGAGQAIEDGWVLGRTLGEHIGGTNPKKLATLEQCAAHYQKVRLPRAQRVQAQSRDAGATYDMQTEDMLEKSYQECIPILAGKTSKRMKFVWSVDLDEVYDTALQENNEQETTFDRA